MAMPPLFSFLQPQQNQSFPPQAQNQSFQQGMDQYQQQGQNLLDPGSTQLAQANPVAMAGRQALGGAFHHAGQMGPPANTLDPSQITWNGPRSDGSMGVQDPSQIMWNSPRSDGSMGQDASQINWNQPNPQALAQGLMQQQNPWSITPDYSKPNFGGKQGVWGG